MSALWRPLVYAGSGWCGWVCSPVYCGRINHIWVAHSLVWCGEYHTRVLLVVMVTLLVCYYHLSRCYQGKCLYLKCTTKCKPGQLAFSCFPLLFGLLFLVSFRFCSLVSYCCVAACVCFKIPGFNYVVV